VRSLSWCRARWLFVTPAGLDQRVELAVDPLVVRDEQVGELRLASAVRNGSLADAERARGATYPTHAGLLARRPTLVNTYFM
jgi:hypothetical protein